MVSFITSLKKFDSYGDKTGWTYIEVPADIAGQLMPGNKKTFRVKGKLDQYAIKNVALMPLGGGAFILPVNMSMRKGTGKKAGAMITVKLELDKTVFKLNEDFRVCLEEEPEALAFFEQFSPSHKKYFNNWIESARTEPTRTKRIAQAINGLLKKQDFGEMIRSLKKEG